MDEREGVETIRQTLFGDCIGRRILDITTGTFGEDDADKVYFHLDNGATFFATIGTERNPGLMGFLDMSNDDEAHGGGEEDQGVA